MDGAMRELTVRLKFVRHCLGNVKAPGTSGRFLLPRTPDGNILFPASWHHANMRFAAKTVGRHQDEVRKILWDINVDGVVRPDNWYKRFYSLKRYVLHESFWPGQVIGLNCIVPVVITDEDFWQLLTVAGQYKGISPWKPGEFGLYTVESIRPRRLSPPLPMDKNTGMEMVRPSEPGNSDGRGEVSTSVEAVSTNLS